MTQQQNEQCVYYYNIRILYSTQTYRSKACARRVARILSEYTTTTTNNNSHIQLQNGNGNTFDDELLLYGNQSIIQYITFLKENDNQVSKIRNDNDDSNIIVIPLLLLFVSTTGDGEQTDSIYNTWKQLYVFFFYLF